MFFGLRDFDRRCAGAMANRLDLRELLAHFGHGPIELDDQDRLRRREVRVHRRFDCDERHAVHDLDSRRNRDERL